MPTTKQTFHPCTSDGKIDLNHTYHSKSPSGAAKKHAARLKNKSGVFSIVNVTRNTSNCLKRKIYTYSYTIKKYTPKRSREKSFMREGKVILPTLEVKVKRVK